MKTRKTIERSVRALGDRFLAGLAGRLIRLAFAVLLGSGTAYAQELCKVPAAVELTNVDRARIEGLGSSRTIGLSAALVSDDADSRRLLADIFGGGLPPPSSDNIAGDYECRTVKLGGFAPITAYGWFRCTITPEEKAFTIRKITGSQRFSGSLYPTEQGYLYRGAQHFSDEDFLFYDLQKQERNQVGCLSGVSKQVDRLVLELPFPAVESLHDTIELRKVN